MPCYTTAPERQRIAAVRALAHKKIPNLTLREQHVGVVPRHGGVQPPAREQPQRTATENRYEEQSRERATENTYAEQSRLRATENSYEETPRRTPISRADTTIRSGNLHRHVAGSSLEAHVSQAHTLRRVLYTATPAVQALQSTTQNGTRFRATLPHRQYRFRHWIRVADAPWCVGVSAVPHVHLPTTSLCAARVPMLYLLHTRTHAHNRSKIPIWLLWMHDWVLTTFGQECSAVEKPCRGGAAQTMLHTASLVYHTWYCNCPGSARPDTMHNVRAFGLGGAGGPVFPCTNDVNADGRIDTLRLMARGGGVGATLVLSSPPRLTSPPTVAVATGGARALAYPATSCTASLSPYTPSGALAVLLATSGGIEGAGAQREVLVAVQ